MRGDHVSEATPRGPGLATDGGTFVDMRSARCPCGLWRLGQTCSCHSIDQVVACAARPRTDREWKAEHFPPTPELM